MALTLINDILTVTVYIYEKLITICNIIIVKSRSSI